MRRRFRPRDDEAVITASGDAPPCIERLSNGTERPYHEHVSTKSDLPTYQRLTLVPCEESYASQVGSRQVQKVVPFLDFVVNGVSLRMMAENAGYDLGSVTSLCRRWVPSHVEMAVDQLLRGNSASTEPVDMLVCSVCGDRNCGAVLADVTVSKEQVVWSNWRWTNYDPTGGEGLDLPTMRFQRSAYEQLLTTAAASVAALPYDETADRLRMRLPCHWGGRLQRGKA